MNKTLAFLKHEFLSALPPTIFFLIAFNIVVLTTALVLAQFEVPLAQHASATILALIIAKVVLVINRINFVRRFDAKPLAYPILFKTVAYSAFVFFFRLLEYWVLSEDIVWRLFAMSQIWIFVLFLVYFTFSELITAFGLSTRGLAKMFFYERPTQTGKAT